MKMLSNILHASHLRDLTEAPAVASAELHVFRGIECDSNPVQPTRPPVTGKAILLFRGIALGKNRAETAQPPATHHCRMVYRGVGYEKDIVSN